MFPGEKFALFVENLDVPILDIGTKMGSTAYIDFIKSSEVTSPIMKGIDCYSRPFITIKAMGSVRSKDVELFQTFFQRYTDNKSLWMGCGHYGPQLFTTSGGMKKEHFNALKDLISGKSVTTEQFSRIDDLKVETIQPVMEEVLATD